MYVLDALMSALGRPQALREIGNGRRVLGVVGRWRHVGARVDLSGSDTIQLVFNVSGGQRVELQRADCSLTRTVRAGSIGVVVPGNPRTVSISGRADTVQIVLTRELIEAVSGRPAPMTLPEVGTCQSSLRAIAVQALVALARGPAGGRATLDQITRRAATLLGQSVRSPPRPARGGLSPAARRRVRALMDDRLRVESCSSLALGELAGAAGLSVHHFVKAFRQTEGGTPYASVLSRRMELALELLLQPDARVDQVSHRTRFSSPSHFVSAFRRHMGVTPGALRTAAAAVR